LASEQQATHAKLQSAAELGTDCGKAAHASEVTRMRRCLQLDPELFLT